MKFEPREIRNNVNVSGGDPGALFLKLLVFLFVIFVVAYFFLVSGLPRDERAPLNFRIDTKQSMEHENAQPSESSQ